MMTARPRIRTQLWTTVGVIALGVAVLALSSDVNSQQAVRRAAPNAGMAALILLAEAMGHKPPPGGIERAVEICGGNSPSLAEVQQAGALMGLDLAQAEVPLGDLPSVPGPAIAAERAPAGYAVYLLRDSEHVQRLDREGLDALPWDALSATYAGSILRLRPGLPRPAVLSVDGFHAVAEGSRPGTTVERTFVLRNEGTQPLEVRVTRTSCTCATTIFGQTPVPAGGESDLRLSVRPQRPGRASYDVVVATNDPYWPRVTLTLTVVVPQTVALYPGSLYMSVTRGSALPRHVTLSAPEGARLTGLATTATWLKARARENRQTTARAEWDLEVTITADAPPGTTSESVAVEMSAPEPTLRLLPVTVRNFGDDASTVPPGEQDADAQSSGARPALRLLYTTDISGFFTPCGCVPGQLGGMARLAALTDDLRKGADELLLLDGGRAVDRPDKAPYFGEIFRLLDYSACGLARQDLSPKWRQWRNALSQHNVPLTSVASGGGNRARALAIPTRYGDIGVLSLPERKRAAEGHAVESAAALIRRQLGPGVRALAVLSRLGTISDLHIAHRLSDESTPVIILGASQSAEVGKLLQVGPVVLAPVGDRGMYISCIDLTVDNQGRLRIGEAQRISVGPDIAERPDVAKVVARYFADQKRLLVAASTRLGNSAPPPPSSCGGCHPEALAHWRRSRHARAVGTLAKEDRLVPDCLPCHSETYRRTGALPEGTADTQDDGVTCATCHLQARAHARAPSRNRTRSATAASDCIACHTPWQQINDFGYTRYLDAIRHW